MTSVREVWAAGDYPAVARFITSAADACVRATDVGPGDHVLDVACGNGNAAIAAARAGGIATGVDITPELLESARASRPTSTGSRATRRFCRSTTTASTSCSRRSVRCSLPTTAEPRARSRAWCARAAGSRSPAGRPRGTIGDFFRTVAKHRPPPPGDSPLLWGTEAHLRELFPDLVLSFERQSVRFQFASAQAAAEFYFFNFGPIVVARTVIEDEAALLDDLRAMFADHGADDGPYPGEYLMVVART